MTTTTTTGISSSRKNNGGRTRRLRKLLCMVVIAILLMMLPLVSLLLVVQYYSPPSLQHLLLILYKPYLFFGITMHFHGADMEYIEQLQQKQKQKQQIAQQIAQSIQNEAGGKKKKKPKKKKKVLAVIEFFQETNSFSPVLTTIQNFHADILLKDPKIILEYCKTKEKLGHIGGFIEGVKDYSTTNENEEDEDEFDIVPILQARSVSGGPLEYNVFIDFVTIIIDGITNLHHTNNDNDDNELVGIYLSLHGAMGVQGIRDPEGYILEQIRNIVGPDMPIGASHDLHANLTNKRMLLLTFLIGYRTNPHRDFYQTGYECGKLLVQTIQNKINPTMAYEKLRQLGGGGTTIDFLYPMNEIFNWMYLQEQQNQNNQPSNNNKILRLSTFMVHPWLDDNELGWSTVAITDNDQELANEKAKELAELNWNIVRHKHRDNNPKHVYDDPKQAIEVAVSELQSSWLLKHKFGCIVICDVADAVGAGAPGESTWILQALIEYDNDDSSNSKPLTSYVTVRDVEAVNFVLNEEGSNSSFSIGDTIKLNAVGGKVDTITNKPISFEGELIYKSTTTTNNDNEAAAAGGAGKIAILKRNGIHLILQEIADPLHSPYYFTDKLGLSLWDADIVVVKNLFPFRYMYWKYNRLTLNVITPGVTNVNIHTIPYKNIPRPIYPLDDNVVSWEPRHNIININVSSIDNDDDDDNNNNASVVDVPTTTTDEEESKEEGETTSNEL